MNHIFQLFLFSLFIKSSRAKPVALLNLDSTLNLEKGTRVYFLTNGTEADLKAIKVTAVNSGISTNVFDHSIPLPDGSLPPIVISADNDALRIEKPDGNKANVTVYYNKVTENLNVFPLFTDSNVRFKAGVNVFFAVDSPVGKVLNVKNLKIGEGKSVVAFAGLPGDRAPPVFFDSSAFKTNNYYDTLNIPRNEFYFAQIDSGVEYEVSFSPETTNFVSSGLLMSDGYPNQPYIGDTLKTLNTNGAQVTLYMKLFTYNAYPYTIDITVYFDGTLQQGYTFSSGVDSKMNANGRISGVEVNANGPYAIQYYIDQAPQNITTTSYVETTTKSSVTYNFLLSVIFVLLLATLSA